MREGDQQTPVGVYHVTASLPRQKLTDFYGSGAFPISYPNDWDRRMGRNGHGIWLHGTPSDTFSRPPKASDGCVVLANQDLDALAQQPASRPDAGHHQQQHRMAVARRLAGRAQVAAGGDRGVAAGLGKPRHRALRPPLLAQVPVRAATTTAAGSQHKRKVNAAKAWIKVDTDNISMFRNPGKEDTMVVVTFEQDYRATTSSNVMKKRQYWIKEDGRWKIVHEGAA